MFLWFNFLAFALVLVDVVIYGDDKTTTESTSSNDDMNSTFTSGTISPFIGTSASISQAPANTTSTPIGQATTAKDCSTKTISVSSYSYNVMEKVSAKVLANNASELLNVSCINCKWNSAEQTLTELEECKEYKIQVNVAGCIKEKSFHVPPDTTKWNLSETHSNTSVTLTWKNIARGCDLNYSFSCDRHPLKGEKHQKHQKLQTGKPYEETLTGLSPNKEYNCTSNITFNGNVTERSILIRTYFGIPEKPENIKKTHNATTVNISWEKPKNEENGPVHGYFIHIYTKKERICRIDVKNATNHTQDELEPYTNHTVEVWAYTNFQEIKLESAKATSSFHTDASKPSEVEDIKWKISKEANNIIEIECRGPQKSNGPKKRYELSWDNNGSIYNSSCKFEVRNLSYLTTYNFTIVFSNGMHKSNGTWVLAKTDYNSGALIIFLAFLIVVTSMALLVVLYKIYDLRRKKPSDSDEPMLPINKDDDKKLMNIDPISAELFWETYRRKMADEGRFFLEEFQSIPRVFSKFPIKDARKPYNQNKNRYVDILPYDYNRVELSAIADVPGSDYINASHIDGFTEPKKYIAAQGPKEETTDDFWRMIWEQKATIVVMVTRCEEGNRVKCAKYWPTMEEGSASYGDIVVKINSCKVCPDYIIQKLQITNRREKTSGRDVTHIQFTSWPDHGVPDNPHLLLKLRRRVNALSNFFSGPIVVHCSAGVGRTGTYIGIDAMLEGLEAEGRVDIYGYVVKLRRQRCLMVQVEAQYILIHQALVEYIQFGETEVSISELHINLNQLKKRDSPSEPSLLEAEFQRLPSFRNWQTQRAGNKDENKSKNRSSTVIPYDYNRVLFKHEEEGSRDGEHNSDDDDTDDESDCEDPNKYINASFISGYWHPSAMIATQGPLPETISDFWSLVFQRKVKVIAMLTELEDNNQELCAQYWKEGKQTYDGLTVELKDVNCCSSYTVRVFDLTHGKRKETRKVFQYQYHKWQNFALPESPKDLVAMIQNIKDKLSSSDVTLEANVYNSNVPLVVHCGDGSQQTGLFCALMNLLESAETEGVIDVFQVVKSLRKARPGMVSTFEGYQFLYDAIASVYPAQNGQLPISQCQKHTADIEKDVKKEEDNDSVAIDMCLSVQESSYDASGHEDSKAKNGLREAETSSNGPTNPVLTEMA